MFAEAIRTQADRRCRRGAPPMSRLLLSAQAAAAATLALTHGGPVLADSGTPVRAVMAQKQLVSGTNCQTAPDARLKPDFVSKSAE